MLGQLVKMAYFFGWATAITLTVLEGLGVISIGWFLATMGFWVPFAAHATLTIARVAFSMICNLLV